MAEEPRPAFRPQRARASLSALPSSTFPSAPTAPSAAGKENGSTISALASLTADATSAKRKKRAQSLGGEALEAARKRIKGLENLRKEDATLELSPGKMERRKAAPRRSILKAVPALFDNNTAPIPGRASLAGPAASISHTTDLSSLQQNTEANAFSRRASAIRRRSSIAPPTNNYDDSDASSDDDGSDMDVTMGMHTAAYDKDGRRYSVSHDRRVSFASAAHIRTFTPDKPTAEAQALASARAQAALLEAEQRAAAGEAGNDTFSTNSSMSFSDDEGEAGGAVQEAVAEDPDASLEISREMAGDSKLRFGGHFAGTNVPTDALELLLEAGEADNSTSTASEVEEDGTMAMDEVTVDGVTSAFQHATGAFHLNSLSQQAKKEDEQVKESATAGSSSAIPPSTTADVPSIYPSLSGLDSIAPKPVQFQLFGAASSHPAAADPPAGPSAAKPRPRFSVAARAEDDEDEEIMRSLGFAKGGKPRKSRIAFAVPEEEEDQSSEENEEMEDATGAIEDATAPFATFIGEDETTAMDLTIAVGGVLSASHPAYEGEGGEEGDSDAEVSMQLTSHFHADRTVDMTFATEAGSASDPMSENGMDDMDQTGTMVEATTYGGILSQSLLSRPSPAPAPSPASIFGASVARPSIGRRKSSPSKLRSVSPVAQRALSPPKSPGRALRGSTPTGTSASTAAPTQSPYRRHTLAPSSPHARRSSSLPSPRRVAVSRAPQEQQQPEQAAAPLPPKSPRRSASPVKLAPPSSLAATAPPKSPRRRSVSPLPPSAMSNVQTRSRSRSRSASPVKQPQSAPFEQATPAKAAAAATFNPRTLAPPQSAGRSPGGSLSLRALLSQDSPAAKGKRVAELKSTGTGGEESELTGSEFDGSFDSGANVTAPPASLDAFFTETGVSFVDDILDLAGVDLAQGRRKSMAPAAGMEEEKGPAGPPSFADMTVAGACKSLFYQLYQSDQLRLHEGINEAQQIYAQHAQAIHDATDADKPRVFKDWASATDEARAIMQSQFRQIKLYYLLQGQVEWKECRGENYQQIIEVMEQNLEGLKEDRAKLDNFDVSSVIPSLEERHAALQADLLAERALDAELSSYSEEQLFQMNELRQGMEEQEIALNGDGASITGLRPAFDREQQQLLSSQAEFNRVASEEARLRAEIADYEERRRDKRTKADLVRLQADFDALQQVQGWELVRFSAQEICMRHWDEFEVIFELVPGSLKVKRAGFELKIDGGRKKASQLGAQITAFLLAKIRDEVERVLADEGEKDARVLLRLISFRSTILRHVRQEITLTSLRYPVAARLITSTGSDPVLELDIDVFCARSRKGFAVVVPLTAAEVIDSPSVDDWARSISPSVKPRFGGNVNALALAQTVSDRLEGGDGRGALLDAVVSVEEECDHA
ncbi:hypothetical protein JCM11641_006254 [Rhodosporidiobolus odoratus]